MLHVYILTCKGCFSLKLEEKRVKRPKPLCLYFSSSLRQNSHLCLCDPGVVVNEFLDWSAENVLEEFDVYSV